MIVITFSLLARLVSPEKLESVVVLPRVAHYLQVGTDVLLGPPCGVYTLDKREGPKVLCACLRLLCPSVHVAHMALPTTLASRALQCLLACLPSVCNLGGDASHEASWGASK